MTQKKISADLLKAVSGIMKDSATTYNEQQKVANEKLLSKYDNQVARPLNQEEAQAGANQVRAKDGRIFGSIMDVYSNSLKKEQANHAERKEYIERQYQKIGGVRPIDEATETKKKHKDLAALAEPKDKVTRKDVLVARGVFAKEAVQKSDVPAYLRKQKGEKPLTLADVKGPRPDSISSKEGLAKLRNEENEAETSMSEGYGSVMYVNKPGHPLHGQKVTVGGTAKMPHKDGGGSHTEIRTSEGKPTSIGHTYLSATAPKSIEESEQIDELSKETLKSYTRKVADIISGNNSKVASKARISNYVKAQNKILAKESWESSDKDTFKHKEGGDVGLEKELYTGGKDSYRITHTVFKLNKKNPRSGGDFHATVLHTGPEKEMRKKYNELKASLSESVEAIDELKKSTLGSYINKAKHSVASTAYRLGAKQEQGDTTNKFANRLVGMNKAVKRLTKEEAEEVTEATHILSGATEFMAKHAKAALEKVGAKITKITDDEDSGTSEYHVSHSQRDRILHASKELEKKGKESYGGLLTKEGFDVPFKSPLAPTKHNNNYSGTFKVNKPGHPLHGQEVKVHMAARSGGAVHVKPVGASSDVKTQKLHADDLDRNDVKENAEVFAKQQAAAAHEAEMAKHRAAKKKADREAAEHEAAARKHEADGKLHKARGDNSYYHANADVDRDRSDAHFKSPSWKMHQDAMDQLHKDADVRRHLDKKRGEANIEAKKEFSKLINDTIKKTLHKESIDESIDESVIASVKHGIYTIAAHAAKFTGDKNTKFGPMRDLKSNPDRLASLNITGKNENRPRQTTHVTVRNRKTGESAHFHVSPNSIQDYGRSADLQPPQKKSVEHFKVLKDYLTGATNESYEQVDEKITYDEHGNKIGGGIYGQGIDLNKPVKPKTPEERQAAAARIDAAMKQAKASMGKKSNPGSGPVKNANEEVEIEEARSSAERLAVAKQMYDSAMKSARSPAERAQAKETYDNVVKRLTTEATDLRAHKVSVTVSDPHHTMASKRKETVEKRVVVKADDKKNAIVKAKEFYEKKGYKVHGAEYHSVQPKSMMKVEETDTPGNSYEHQCAVHVKHAKLGEGRTLPTQHADINEEGQIEWYDVMFESGIVRVPTVELDILVSESHMHTKRKKGMK
jgi:hypothetical protein